MKRCVICDQDGQCIFLIITDDYPDGLKVLLLKLWGKTILLIGGNFISSKIKLHIKEYIKQYVREK